MHEILDTKLPEFTPFPIPGEELLKRYFNLSTTVCCDVLIQPKTIKINHN